jgi:hypothetical protein
LRFKGVVDSKPHGKDMLVVVVDELIVQPVGAAAAAVVEIRVISQETLRHVADGDLDPDGGVNIKPGEVSVRDWDSPARAECPLDRIDHG